MIQLTTLIQQLVDREFPDGEFPLPSSASWVGGVSYLTHRLTKQLTTVVDCLSMTMHSPVDENKDVLSKTCKEAVLTCCSIATMTGIELVDIWPEDSVDLYYAEQVDALGRTIFREMGNLSDVVGKSLRTHENDLKKQVLFIRYSLVALLAMISSILNVIDRTLEECLNEGE